MAQEEQSVHGVLYARTPQTYCGLGLSHEITTTDDPDKVICSNCVRIMRIMKILPPLEPTTRGRGRPVGSVKEKW